MPAKNSKYDPEETPILIEQYARDGMINEEIARKLGIAVSTLYDWQKKFPEVSEALKNGKEVVDAQVEKALLKKAIGYTFTETKKIVEADGKRRVEKIERQAHPDVAAQIFWLKNRKPDEWRDRHHEDKHKADADAGVKAFVDALKGVAKNGWDEG